MDFREVVARRRVVRSYTAEPVEPAVIQRVLDTARRAPSAGFAQGQSFVVVHDASDRERIAELCDEPAYRARGFEPWLSRAPVHVVVCTQRGRYEARYAEPDKADAPTLDAWRVPFWWVDGGAALMLLLLAAVDEGLGAGFLAVDDDDGLRALLGIPPEVDPVGLVTLGYPAAQQPEGSARRGRRPLDAVVHHGRWGRPAP